MAKRKNNLEKTNHKLSILTSQGGFSFLVHSADEILKLKHQSCKAKSPEDQIENIKKVIDDEFIINHQIDQAQLIFDNALFTNVPDTYFDKDQAPHYLKYNTELLTGDFIDYDEITRQNLKLVYIPIMNIYTYLADKIGNVGYQHQMSAFLKCIHPDQTKKESIFINLYFDSCYIIAYYEGGCHLANRFEVQNDEDAAYYLFTVIDQLKFDRENLQLMLSGFINKEDQVYKYFYDYIRNIKFYQLSFPTDHFLHNAISHKETNIACHYHLE